MIRPPLDLMNGRLPRRGGAPRKHAQDAHPVGIHLVSEAVSDGLQRMLGRSKLAHIGSGVQANAGIDEHDLTPMRSQHRQQGLRQDVGGANIATVLPVKFCDRRALEPTEKDDAGTVNKQVNVAKISLKPCGQLPYIFVQRQVSTIAENFRRGRASALGHRFQRF